MRDSELDPKSTVCEGCERTLRSSIVIGIEVAASAYAPISLCSRCGPIDLELMQFCRELIIACSDS